MFLEVTFAMNTLDILSDYMAEPHAEIANFISKIDTPANGIAMEVNYQSAFDDCEFCLEPVPNVS